MSNCKTNPAQENHALPAANVALSGLTINRVIGTNWSEAVDLLSVEEPLEIKVRVAGSEMVRSIAVTMRTPGEDEELATGFLYTEAIISEIDQIAKITRHGCNTLEITLREDIEIDPAHLERHSFIASSCGVCGKKSIEAVQARRKYSPDNPFPQIDAETIKKLPELLMASQQSFGLTGGIHASGLFSTSGDILMVREDVGRHNALDKLIGACARRGMLPLQNKILLVSGRASFELVQKAAHAGITTMAAVGAPSSLAVELAQNSGMSLVGFVRSDRFNVYTHKRSDLKAAPSLEPTLEPVL